MAESKSERASDTDAKRARVDDDLQNTSVLQTLQTLRSNNMDEKAYKDGDLNPVQMMTIMSQMQEQMRASMRLLETAVTAMASKPSSASSSSAQESGQVHTVPECQVKWSEDVTSLIATEQKQVEKRIRAYFKARKTAATATSRAEKMNVDDGKQIYPDGIKACVIGKQDPEGDEPWTACVDASYEVSIRVPKGTSRRSAIEIFYYAYARARANIDMETEKAIAENRKTAASKQQFYEACEKAIQTLNESEMSAALGVSSVRSMPTKEARDMHYEKLYAESTERIAIERQKHDAETDKQKEKDKKTEDALDAENPITLLKKVVTKAAQAASGEDAMADSNGTDIELDKDYEKLAKLLVSPKKGNPLETSRGNLHEETRTQTRARRMPRMPTIPTANPAGVPGATKAKARARARRARTASQTAAKVAKLAGGAAIVQGTES
eukprot:TRINITY_DN1742_c3_g1_i1.p1 TRINITY_DN1742_c3_g1~~TRINITY_DN1742_c3_g1_i1.p1  ORF type:complete len:440 (-),score=89.77 TRINITY_DN1742_c3_g1_i1:1232-2551(-)